MVLLTGWCQVPSEDAAKINIEIEAMQVKFSILELKPNDVLVFSIPDNLPQFELDKFKRGMIKHLKEELNIPNKLIIVAGGAQFGVIRQL